MFADDNKKVSYLIKDKNSSDWTNDEIRLTPISGLKKTIKVNTENFQTNKPGIFAIGDICTYPGKLKLILSGFHEGALAARGCFEIARPNEIYRFEYSTTSKSMQERLGVKKSDWSSFCKHS